MNQSSPSMFPTLVVAGHIVTMVVVWHWRRRRRALQDAEGKRGGCMEGGVSVYWGGGGSVNSVSAGLVNAVSWY